MADRKLRGVCWLLDEGTPGHRAQSEGVIKLLQDAGWQLDVHKLVVRNRLPGFLRPLWRWLFSRLPHCVLPLLRWCACELGARPTVRPDFIISSGGKSAFASFVVRRQLSCRNVFVGVPDPFPDTWFDLIVSPVQRPFSTQYVVSGIIPNTVTRQSVVDAGSLYWEQHQPAQPCWAIMIGGPSKSHRFQDADWQGLVEGINALARKHGIKWLLSTSRRTPLHVEELLAQRLDPAAIQELVLYNQKPKKILLPFLYMAERVFITQDSLTMASEAFNSCKPVILLAPQDVALQSGSFFEEMIRSFPSLPNMTRVLIQGLSDYRPQPPVEKQSGADFTLHLSSQLSVALRALL